MRRVFSSYMRSDPRTQQVPQAEKCIFKDSNYEIRMQVYSSPARKGVPQESLVAAEVTYLRENLQVLVKLWSHRITGDMDQFFRESVLKLEKRGETPVQMIGEAKEWCSIPLTAVDLAYLQGVN
jgi:hypothetical protein